MVLNMLHMKTGKVDMASTYKFLCVKNMQKKKNIYIYIVTYVIHWCYNYFSSKEYWFKLKNKPDA